MRAKRKKTDATSKRPSGGSPIPPRSPSPTSKSDANSGYRIIILPDARKELAALPGKVRGQVNRRIQALAHDPRPPGSKLLKGEWAGLWRARSGDYRIVYQVRDDRLLVTVVKVGDRKDVYD